MKFKDALKRSIAMFDSNEFEERIREEDATMLKQLPLLKDMNRHKFLTLDSQAGLHRRFISVKDGKPSEIYERAYVTGFMLNKDAIEFIKNFNILTDKNAVYIPFCNNDVCVPPALDMPLTIIKQGKHTEVVTHTGFTYPTIYMEQIRKSSHINKSEPIALVYCWDTKWNRLASGKNGLFTDVLKILKQL